MSEGINAPADRAARWKAAVKRAAIGAVLAASAAAQADARPARIDPPTTAKLDEANAKIQALETELQELSAQVADLKASSANEAADLRASQAALPAVTLANGRPTITSPDGSARFAVRAMLQFDATRYFENNKTTLDLNSGANFRRARLGVEGAYKDWSYALTGEFGGSGAEAPV